MDSNKEDSVDSNDKLSTLVAMEKSPDDKMKTVIKKTVLPKTLVKTAVLDFSNLSVLKKTEEAKDNLKDSGICLDEDPSTSDGVKKVRVSRKIMELSKRFLYLLNIHTVYRTTQKLCKHKTRTNLFG